MPSLEFKDISVIFLDKSKKETIALNHLNLSLSSGKIHAVLGFSGSGKSTLLKTLIGSFPYEGKILLDGQDIELTSVKDRHMAYVSQNYALYPHMSVFDNIAFPLKNMGASSEEIKERVFSIASELGIEVCLTRKPKSISGGQQQRVALARALVKNPSLCLLDEPLSNLDESSSFKGRQLIYSCLKKRGITSIYVTHDIAEATSLADEIHVINEGEIIFNGTADEFISSNDPVVLSLLS